jgi:hypothetical protein
MPTRPRWLLVLPLIFPAFLLAQPLPHNRCSEARVLEIGEIVYGENNAEADIFPEELPDSVDITCIRTFENDLWYTFTTDSAYSFYEVIIEPQSCETPAGLQALVFAADDGCNPGGFQNQACTNPRETRLLRLSWQEFEPGRTYFLYVDGYDGNRCVFDLSLNGYHQDPRSNQDLRRLSLDYNQPAAADFLPPGLHATFMNNEAVIRWEAEPDAAVEFFLVEKYWATPYRDKTRHSGKVLGLVEARATVGDGSERTYEFIDNRPFAPEEKLCYRIVAVDGQAQRRYSEVICLRADLVEDFFISPVVGSTEPEVYEFQFINYRKQDLRFDLLAKPGGEVLKGLTMQKVRKGENGALTLDMREYQPGTYYLRVRGDKAEFLRRFERTP